jgi:hypothetical protein
MKTDEVKSKPIKCPNGSIAWHQFGLGTDFDSLATLFWEAYWLVFAFDVYSHVLHGWQPTADLLP